MFQYVYTTRMTIIFDDEFEVNLTASLDQAVNKIEMASDMYGFSKADVIDSDTGEILIQWVDE